MTFYQRQIRVEATRLARNMVKEAIKAEGLRVSFISTKELAQAAYALLKHERTLFTRAANNIAARNWSKQWKS